jgi:hypothetical protein
MAITNTRTVGRIETYPADTADGDPRLMVVYEHTFDDSTDDALPVTSTVVKHLQRYVVTTDEDGNETSTATDVTGEDQLVQDICGAIWTD